MGKRTEGERNFTWNMGEAERNPHTAPLAAIHSASGLIEYLQAERTRRIERILHPLHGEGEDFLAPGGVELSRSLSDVMDAVITRMFQLACQNARVNFAVLPVAIVATGGYGRRELAPYSDIDLTFVPQRDGDPATDRVLREMFRLVMDVLMNGCHLEVGYAYRLLEDCGNLDHQTACGLLDARLLAGSPRLFIQLEDAYWMGFNPAEFIFAKLQERAGRLAKWGQTPRSVEPNLKEGAGGLRDLQTAVWLMQARHHLAPARVRGARAFDALMQTADVSPQDADGLAGAKERLMQVRNALHAAAGAHRDQLVVTRQEEVAGLLMPLSPVGEPPLEAFMARLYDSLSVIHRNSRLVIQRVENSRLILGIGLDCKRRQIVPANDALISEDPIWLLWACELAQRYHLQLSDETQQAMLSLLSMHPVLTHSADAAHIFTQILSRPGSLTPVLQQMADLGILGWILPEFAAIFNLIPYDPSHELTVGQHTLSVIQHLEELLLPGNDPEREPLRRLLKEMPHPEQLILAALLHDTGKAVPGRPHSETGEDIAAEVCRRLHWSAEASATVCFLVRQHLLMAETSRLRDLNMEETIRDFTRVVDDPERLNMLTLLTYADTRAVGAGVWTPVKQRYLNELWQRATSLLCEEESQDGTEATVARARRRLLKDLSLTNLPENEVAEHMEAMPPYYLLNQDLQRIALHIEFVRRVRAGSPVIDFQENRQLGVTELTVCASDDPHPGLLAKIAGTLCAADLDVHNAQVVTRITAQDRIAIDTLWVDYKARPLSPGKQREVANLLTSILTGKDDLSALLQRHTQRNRRSRSDTIAQGGAIKVLTLRNDLSETLTVIETESPVVRSALYHVSAALSQLGWDIQSAKVSSWKGAARASFYIFGAHHLPEHIARPQLEAALPAGAADPNAC